MEDNNISLKLGKELMEYRKRNDISQVQIAKQLGITQMQVSRIEKGQIKIADNILSKIQKLIKKPLFEYNFNLNTISDRAWNYAYLVYPEKYSGDGINIDNKNLPDKTIIFHTDAVGSDLTASANMDLIEICSQISSSTLELGANPESAYYKLNKMYKNIKSAIRGEPSVSIIFASQYFDKIEFINGGMPNFLIYRQNESSITAINEDKFPALGLLGAKEYVSSTGVHINKGDVFFSFSDGFIELYKKNSSLKLEHFLMSVSNAYKGDAESIGSRLSKYLAEITKNTTISDDVSYLVISKK